MSLVFLFSVFVFHFSSYATSNFEKIKRMAELGDTVAQLNVGNSYYTGDGIPQNYDEAAKWYRFAAKKGNPIAQNNLGMMYSIGVGVRKYLSGLTCGHQSRLLKVTTKPK